MQRKKRTKKKTPIRFLSTYSFNVSLFLTKAKPCPPETQNFNIMQLDKKAQPYYQGQATYVYHPDHLGSTSLETNSYGEVFVEETAGGWAFDDLIVVAPSNNVQVGVEGKLGVKEKGVWNIFYKGDIVDSFSGKTKPIFSNPNKVVEKYEKKWNDAHQGE